jgi:hypothetical protein
MHRLSDFPREKFLEVAEEILNELHEINEKMKRLVDSCVPFVP